MNQYEFPPDKRLLPETNIRQVQAVVLRMLKIMDIICNVHDIDFWLEYGTLLGAVRHEGFIPWDDEADIGMLRSDFDKFLAVASALPNDIFLQTPDTDPFYQGTDPIEAKLRDKYSNYIEFARQRPDAEWHNGIQVDIFVYDYDELSGGHFTNAFERFYGNSKIHLKQKELERTVEWKFEDHSFQVPVGYDAYLQRNYGNYLELPPTGQRKIPNIEIISPCKHREILFWEKS